MNVNLKTCVDVIIVHKLTFVGAVHTIFMIYVKYLSCLE